MTRLVATFGIRWEPQWLVDDMVANLSPWVDDFACIDDRSRDPGEVWGHEGNFRRRQRELCAKMRADWILVCCPDERWEDRAGDVVRPLIDGRKHKKIYRFHCREMFTPTAYRVDGRWGHRPRARLYPLLPNQQMAYHKRIHSADTPRNRDYQRVTLDLNFYHLKMIEPENRARRAQVFTDLDPTFSCQPSMRTIGWDYMTDETGMALEEIPPGRGYSPAHTRRYLWDPTPQQVGAR